MLLDCSIHRCQVFRECWLLLLPLAGCLTSISQCFEEHQMTLLGYPQGVMTWPGGRSYVLVGEPTCRTQGHGPG